MRNVEICQKIYLVQVYVTTRPESLAIEVLQFGEGFQVYSKREKSAEHFYISVTQMMNYTHITFQ